MNHVQFVLFIVYIFSILSAGMGIYELFNKARESYLNRPIYLAESFLLGASLLVGELLLLSLMGLYKAPYLWGAVALHYLFLINRTARESFVAALTKKPRLDPPTGAFLILMGIFIFRNCYFLVDVDSHASYLFTQKLWLATGSSLQGGADRNFGIFTPQFDSIPYGLGVSLFGREVLFPQLVNLSWRVVALLLVFGYGGFRLNGYFGLAAAMLVAFNDHFFYSGANHPVIINGAIAALFFAAAYNFWESHVQNSLWRFVLAIVFASQIMANKYQMAYSLILMCLLGILLQPHAGATLKALFQKRRALAAVVISVFFVSLWYWKNFLITGVPTFPLYAGYFHAVNWTPEHAAIHAKVFSGLKFQTLLKYLNYLFIWPGITAAKYVIVIISFLPLIFFAAMMKNRTDNKAALEFCFWLGLSLLVMMGHCLACFFEPRYYRYLIGIFSFTAVFSMFYVLRYSMNIKNELVIGLMAIVLALPGYKIVFQQGGPSLRPTFKENAEVILNKLHFDDVIEKHYPKTAIALKGFQENKDKAGKAAWDLGISGANIALSAFLLPVRPQIGLWNSTAIRWDSYDQPEAIVNDLKALGVEYVMDVKDNQLVMTPIADYAREAARHIAPQRYPQSRVYDYGFPEELTKIPY